MSAKRIGFVFASLATLSCTGSIDDLDGSIEGPFGPSKERNVGTNPSSVKPESAGPWTLRRLTAREYNNTVRDLLHLPTYPGITLPTIDAQGPSGFSTAEAVTTAHARAFLDAAEELAVAALNSTSSRLLPCSPMTSADEEPCAVRFIADFGKRAFRRPLAADEADDLVALYREARGNLGQDFRGAIGLLVQRFLQSASFLYHRERGPETVVRDGALVRLGPYEVASRLSYLLWESMPDPQLLSAAGSGDIVRPEALVRETMRLLSDKRATSTLASFHQQWLAMSGVGNKDPKLFPDFDMKVRPWLDAELAAFVDYVFRGDGQLGTLLAAPVAFATWDTARLYGLSAGVASTLSPSKLSRIDLDPTRRAGLLTQLPFLADRAAASRSNVVKRGASIWKRVVCGPIGAPSDNLRSQIDAQTRSDASERDKAAARKANGVCGGCHGMLDPSGLAFEHYDATGAYRMTDQGAEVDSSGSLTLPIAGAITFGSAVDLMRALAGTEDVRRCVVRQWMRYALGRRETEAEEGSIGAVHDQAAGARSFDMRQVVRGIATSRAFLWRTPSPGEMP